MAKKRGVVGWHEMRKEQLVQALLKTARRKRKSAAAKSRSRSTSTASNSKSKSAASSKKTTRRAASTKTKRASNGRVRKKIAQLQQRVEGRRNLASRNGKNGTSTDRLAVMVRDPFWLHAYWELTRQSVLRVQAAMGHAWHTSRPQLRLYEVSDGGERVASDKLIRTINIHGGVNNWYVDVVDPPKTYRLEIGYAADDDRFFAIARSNIVRTPSPASRDTLDQNWADVAENFEKIYAMSGGYSQESTSEELRELLEERLRRPMGAPVVMRYGAAVTNPRREEFHFEADAEMIIFGKTDPEARVMLKGEPIQVRQDGTFTVRMQMPDCRQVIPIVANSSDGSQQRTIALAVERNTKQMETVVKEKHP